MTTLIYGGLDLGMGCWADRAIRRSLKVFGWVSSRGIRVLRGLHAHSGVLVSHGWGSGDVAILSLAGHWRLIVSNARISRRSSPVVLGLPIQRLWGCRADVSQDSESSHIAISSGRRGRRRRRRLGLRQEEITNGIVLHWLFGCWHGGARSFLSVQIGSRIGESRQIRSCFFGNIGVVIAGFGLHLGRQFVQDGSRFELLDRRAQRPVPELLVCRQIVSDRNLFSVNVSQLAEPPHGSANLRAIGRVQHAQVVDGRLIGSRSVRYTTGWIGDEDDRFPRHNVGARLLLVVLARG